MRRRRNILARQVSLFPVLMLVDEDDATGRITFHPLPIELQWQLTVNWVWLTVIGLARFIWSRVVNLCRQTVKDLKTHLQRRLQLSQPAVLRRAPRIGQWFRGVRLHLEIRTAIILGQQLGLAAVGR